ncbi:MAG: SsrA-binding protein SmpB [Rickettsiales bacterium]|jgi:SsrA-binding protein|nr:SsrA-binding protein SmpB [Rickettsiales bacterium]
MPRQLIKSGQVALNRRARFDYSIEDRIEAGLSLTGAEVKSIRYGMVSLADSFVHARGDNLVVKNMAIQPLPTANKAVRFDERRDKQLLLHKSQIRRLRGKLIEKGATIVPLRLYFNNRGIVKVLLGVGFGKSQIDKRETIKKREWLRDKARALSGGKR